MADDKNRSNFFSTAVMASPLAAGLGYSTYQNLTGSSLSPKVSSVAAMMKSLQGMQAQTAGHVGNKQFIEWVKNNPASTPRDQKVMQTAWTQAMRSADTLAIRGMDPIASKIGSVPLGEVHSGIQRAMASDSSNLGNSVYRIFQQNVVALSSFGGAQDFGVSSAKIPGMVQRIQALPDNLATRASKIAETLGPYSSVWHTRTGWEEHGLGAFALEFGTTKVELPMVQHFEGSGLGGVLVQGKSQRTRRIAPSFWVMDKELGSISAKMTAPEFFLERIEKEVLPKVTKGELKGKAVERAIKNISTDVFGSMEYSPNVTDTMRTGAIALREKERAAQVNIVTLGNTGYEEASEKDFYKAIEKEGLHAGVSPGGLAKSRASTLDIGQKQMFPSLATHSRRYEQSTREWGMSNETKKMLQSQKNDRYASYIREFQKGEATSFKNVTNPHVKIMYIDQERFRKTMVDEFTGIHGFTSDMANKKADDFFNKLNIGEGEFRTSSNLSMFEFDTVKEERFSLKGVRKDIAEKLRSGEIPTLNEGETIGFNQKGPITYNKKMELLGAFDHTSSNGEDLISIAYKQKERFQHGSKTFGTLKGLMLFQADKTLQEQAARAGRWNSFTANTDIMADIKVLKKDPSRHAQQMVYGFRDVLGTRGKISDPMALASAIEAVATEKKGNIHRNIVNEIMGLALDKEGANLSPSEFGAVFGSLPSVFDEKEAIGIAKKMGASEEHISEMLRGVVMGGGELAYAGPASDTGAGAMGSLEPRMLQELRSGTFGQTGSEIADDLTKRLAYTNPEKLAIHQELSKTLSSISGHATSKKGDRLFDASKENIRDFRQFVKSGGGWLVPGKEQASIYIPGSETIDAMRAYKVGDKEVFGSMYQDFEDLARSATSMYGDYDTLGTPDFLKEQDKFIGSIGKHWAAGGKGLGGVGRGKVIGSRFLRGMSEMYGEGTTFRAKDLLESHPNTQVVGISRGSFDAMLDDMATSGMYDRSQLETMRTDFRKGIGVAGLVGRHPAIGPFSTQAATFFEVAGSNEQMILPELSYKMKVGGEDLKLQLGPLLGMAGDKDADIYSAMLVSPDSEKALRKQVLIPDSEFMRRYTEHQVRYQMLGSGGRPIAKGSESLGGLLSASAELADIKKLGTTQRWIPQLSNEMSSLKRAVSAFGTGAQAADAKTLLEWLEQTPIAAKHLTAEGVMSGELSNMLEGLQTSLQNKDARLLESTIQDVIKLNPIATKLFEGDVKISSQDAANISKITGGNIGTNIKALDLKGTISNMFSMAKDYEKSGAREAELLMGKGQGMRRSEVGLVAKSMTKMKAGGFFSKVAASAITASNSLAKIGRSMISNHKAVGFGFAGTLALGAILSEPPRTVGPGASKIPQGSLNMRPGRAASRISQETVMPNGQQLGSPTAPNMLDSRRVLLAGAGESARISVNARTSSMISPEAFAGAIGGIGGQSRSISINLRDSRSQLNPYIEGNKIRF